MSKYVPIGDCDRITCGNWNSKYKNHCQALNSTGDCTSQCFAAMTLQKRARIVDDEKDWAKCLYSMGRTNSFTYNETIDELSEEQNELEWRWKCVKCLVVLFDEIGSEQTALLLKRTAQELTKAS